MGNGGGVSAGRATFERSSERERTAPPWERRFVIERAKRTWDAGGVGAGREATYSWDADIGGVGAGREGTYSRVMSFIENEISTLAFARLANVCDRGLAGRPIRAFVRGERAMAILSAINGGL